MPNATPLPLPSQAELRRLLTPCYDTGELTWNIRQRSAFTTNLSCATWNTRYGGKRAGSVRRDGYVYVECAPKKFLAHRLIWTMAHGPIPEGMLIDHINGLRSDNRLANLRLVTIAQNNLNQRMHGHNTSGFSGVSWDAAKSMWCALGIVNRVRNCWDIFPQKRRLTKL